MKVLFLIPDCLNQPMGGMGEQCRQLVKRLKCNCEVIGTNEIFKPSIPVGITDPIINSFLNQACFVDAASEREFDIVHAFDWSTFYAGVILSQRRQVPLVVTVQLSISQLSQSLSARNVTDADLMAAGVELMGLNRADHIIQVSDSYAKSFPSVFSPKTTVIPNGIDNREWLGRRPFNLPGSRKFKIVYIGRIAYQKGVHNLLRSEIPEDVDLIYIGGNRGSNTELLDEVIRQSKERGGVHYLGPLYGDEKIGALQAADAVVMPSIHEPFGIVALEALASKSILLSSFVNGMGDFLTNDVAINCGTTPESISEAMQCVVTMNDEDKQRRIIGGLAICQKYDWDNIVRKLEGVYSQCLQSRMERAA